MIFKAFCILFFTLPFLCPAQNTKDVGFIKNQPYLKYAKHINCDSTSGTTLEQRICLNIKLRRIDSIMLSKFNQVLSKIENDSLINVFKTNQSHWEAERKSIGMLKSEGYEHSAEAIMYMHYMIQATETRILTLDILLEELY
jgi:uncharacterized protein YecT (DUF1311 family)